jgi:hypothetical protein
MDQLITGFVDRVLVPIIDAFVPLLVNGGGLVIFALIWAAFAYGLIASQGSLDAAWQWIRALPFVVQALVWLLFLPAVVGLWIWETAWPIAVRLVLIVSLAGWNLWIFLPKALTAARP